MPKISISNIAWSPEHNESIVNILNKLGVEFIDIAPSKCFKDPFKATKEELLEYKKWWFSRGIRFLGMQSLLYGTEGLNVFSNAIIQSELLKHLTGVCRFASLMGIERLVFGSPKNRDRTGLTNQEAEDIALVFFHKLGAIAHQYDVVICLEPNAAQYGTNFLVSTEETSTFVRKLGHPNIAMQFDVGTFLLNKEKIDSVPQMLECVRHVHLSEPYLKSLGKTSPDGERLYRVIADMWKDPVCIEMLSTGKESELAVVETAIRYVQKFMGE